MRESDAMKICGTLIFFALLISTAASAAEKIKAKPTLVELINQGYVPMASGEIVLRRTFIPLLDIGILIHPYHHRSCIGGPVATIDRAADSCAVRDVLVRKARFFRMVKDSAQFVCILYSSDECHRAY